MDANKFNVLTGDAGRATLSVLTHNAILQGNDGIVAEDEDHVDSGIHGASLTVADIQNGRNAPATN